MDDIELKSIISNEITNSLGFDGSLLSDERMRLQQYYEGTLPRGSGIPDRSQIKDRCVMEVIHWLLPELARVLLSGEKVISFEPRTPDDSALAQEITDYVAFILAEDNEFFKLGYSWIKTALILKNSFMKVSFEPQTVITMNSFTGLTDEELKALLQELGNADKYEIKEQNDYPDPNFVPPPIPQGMPIPMLAQRSPNAPQGASQPGAPPGAPPQPLPPEAYKPPTLHDIRCRVYDTDGRVVLRHVLPEEVLISRRCPETNFNGDHFVAHRALKTVSDLRLLGYDDELIEEARGASTDFEWNQERVTRFAKDDLDNPTERTDEAMQPIWISECYLKVDYDDDGIAELRRVVTAGDGAVIFENEECDGVPLVSLTPIIEPGRAIGTSVAELVVDLQETKSAMLRGVMDSCYLSLVPRNLVNVNKITEDFFDDMNEGSPGSSIRVNDDGAVTPIEVPFMGQAAVPVLDLINQSIQQRTGVGPQNNIISPDVLNNQTAAGISMQQTAASAQIELICRVMAETGFKELARHVLSLVVKHQDKPRVIRLNGNFVEMDPRNFHENFDIQVTVGLGTGNKVKTTQDLMGVLQIMQPIIAAQKSLTGPFITSQDVHMVVKKLTEAMGYREDFMPHLAQPQQSPGGQQPDPEMMKAQQQGQIEQAKGQAAIQLQQQKAELEGKLAQQKAQLESQLAQEKHQAEMQRDMEKAQQQMQIEAMRERHKQEMQSAQLQAQLAMDMTP